MIRDMRRNGAQPKDTMHKAEVAMVTGMGVVIKDSKTVALPSEETVANIYVATKERIAKGTNAALTNMSDYHEDFVNIEVNELIGLERYTDGEKFATDQYKAADFEAVEAAFPVAVGTDGKWMKSTKASKYVCEGIHIDNGHRLIVIRVEADAVAV